MMDTNKAIVIEFPLRGEWACPNTPGTRIPSHGTNKLASRYAYDFLQVDWKKKKTPCYRVHPLRYLLFGVSVQDCYCYGNEVYAPCDGVVVQIEKDCKERKRAYLFSDLYRSYKNSRYDSKKNKLTEVAGNYVILKNEDGYCFVFCHLQPFSIPISLGQTLRKGEVLGRVGHSGNSMFPHLHFQLMSDVDMRIAKAMPCAFEYYEKWSHGTWIPVYNGVPKSDERIRFMK